MFRLCYSDNKTVPSCSFIFLCTGSMLVDVQLSDDAYLGESVGNLQGVSMSFTAGRLAGSGLDASPG